MANMHLQDSQIPPQTGIVNNERQGQQQLLQPAATNANIPMQQQQQPQQLFQSVQSESRAACGLCRGRMKYNKLRSKGTRTCDKCLNKSINPGDGNFVCFNHDNYNKFGGYRICLSCGGVKRNTDFTPTTMIGHPNGNIPMQQQPQQLYQYPNGMAGHLNANIPMQQQQQLRMNAYQFSAMQPQHPPKPTTAIQHICLGVKAVIHWIYATIKLIFNLFSAALWIGFAAISVRHFAPGHPVSIKINSIFNNMTEAYAGPLKEREMYSLVTGYQVQLEESGTKLDVDVSDVQYDHIQKFGDIIIGEFYNLSDVKTAIKESPVPPDVSKHVLDRVIEGNYIYCPQSSSYTASQDSNGGAGFKYCLQIQKPQGLEMYQMIYTVAGRSFKVASQIEYREERSPQVVPYTEDGILGKYQKAKIVDKIIQKKIVTPITISESKFEEIVRETYIEYAHEEAAKQLQSKLHQLQLKLNPQITE